MKNPSYHFHYFTYSFVSDHLSSRSLGLEKFIFQCYEIIGLLCNINNHIVTRWRRWFLITEFSRNICSLNFIISKLSITVFYILISFIVSWVFLGFLYVYCHVLNWSISLVYSHIPYVFRGGRNNITYVNSKWEWRKCHLVLRFFVT